MIISCVMKYFLGYFILNLLRFSMFKSASEYVGALKQITSNKTLLGQRKEIYSDILSESIPFISAMSAPELRSFSKSVLIIHSRFGLNLNNYLLKAIDRRIIDFIGSGSSPENRHALVGSMSHLSQVIRQRHDGGPPALRPDNVWKFVHQPQWRPLWLEPNISCVMDKCELLTILSRLSIRPFDAVFSDIFFPKSDVELFRTGDDRTRINGRICGAINSMAKLRKSENHIFDDFLHLVPSRIHELSNFELGNIAHASATSLVVNDNLSDCEFKIQLVVTILRRLCRDKRQLSAATVNQIALTGLALEYLPERPVMSDEIKVFLRTCLEASCSDSTNMITVSKAQSVIRKAFDQLGLGEMVLEEFAVGPFRIDFCVAKLKLLIEINGPYHYYYKSTLRTARTEFKHRMLTKMGFLVIDIDFLEMKDQDDRVALLEKKLRDALGLVHSRPGRLKSDILKLVNSV